MPVQYRNKDTLIECFGTRLGGLEIRVNGKTIAIARQPDLRNEILIADGLAYTRLQPEFDAFKARHY